MVTRTATSVDMRAQVTREALLLAARQVLKRTGYSGATVAQIAKEARRAHGTFYVYFKNLEDIYANLLEDMWADLKLQGRAMWHADEPMKSVTVTIQRFIVAYQANLDLWELAEDMSATNPQFRKLRNEHHALLARKVCKGIEGSLPFGHIDGLDVEVLGEILAGMLESACRSNFRGGKNWPIEVLARHMAEVWGRALGYETVQG
jgi:AcrR family transcriptional regulator